MSLAVQVRMSAIRRRAWWRIAAGARRLEDIDEVAGHLLLQAPRVVEAAAGDQVYGPGQKPLKGVGYPGEAKQAQGLSIDRVDNDINIAVGPGLIAGDRPEQAEVRCAKGDQFTLVDRQSRHDMGAVHDSSLATLRPLVTRGGGRGLW